MRRFSFPLPPGTVYADGGRWVQHETWPNAAPVDRMAHRYTDGRTWCDPLVGLGYGPLVNEGGLICPDCLTLTAPRERD